MSLKNTAAAEENLEGNKEQGIQQNRFHLGLQLPAEQRGCRGELPAASGGGHAR